MSMQEAVKEYYAKRCIKNQNNPSKLWKTILEVLEKINRSTAVLLIEHEERQITDKEDILSAFNEHFTKFGLLLNG